MENTNINITPEKNQEQNIKIETNKPEVQKEHQTQVTVSVPETEK